MTLPYERYRAVLWAEEFLADLCDSKKTPRVPAEIRRQAGQILRHYPSEWHMAVVAEQVPQVFAEDMEDLHRFIASAWRDSVDGDEKS